MMHRGDEPAHWAARLDIVTLTQNALDALEIDGSVEDVHALQLIDALRK